MKPEGKHEFGSLYAGRMSDRNFVKFMDHNFWDKGIRGCKLKISTILENGMLENKPVFILGGGYSINLFDLKKLKKHFTIGCNFIWEVFDPTINIMTDHGVVKNRMLNDKKYLFSKSIKLLVDLSNAKWDYYYSRACGYMGHSNDVDWLYHGSHTGYAAVQLAFALKANPIYLLGFDFQFYEDENGKTHSHCHENWIARQEYEKTLKQFNFEMRCLYREFSNGTQLINLSPISLIDYMPFKDFNEVVNA